MDRVEIIIRAQGNYSVWVRWIRLWAGKILLHCLHRPRLELEDDASEPSALFRSTAIPEPFLVPASGVLDRANSCYFLSTVHLADLPCQGFLSSRSNESGPERPEFCGASLSSM